MDIEELAVRYLGSGSRDQALLERLREVMDTDGLDALLKEISMSEGADDLDYALPPISGVTAGASGLGCRGTGDSIIHRLIVSLLPTSGLSVSPADMDDSGALRFGNGHIVLSVDGIHSRLSRFPFLAGFHAARAALRDVMVMGAAPLAMTSDVHIANDGDVGCVFDMVAGVGAVSELTGVPVAGGSTLRIGGDMVLGTRLTGSVGAVGHAENLTARSGIAQGDVLLMTMGSGGGTIATTAIYNGHPEVVGRTLNIDFHRDISSVRDLVGSVHAMVDVTNGGIRGDAMDLVAGRDLDIALDPEALRLCVDPVVLDMLDRVGIDHMGVSTDSILLSLPEDPAREVAAAIRKGGGTVHTVGAVENGTGSVLLGDDRETLEPAFREEPYTPLKKVVSLERPDIEAIGKALNAAAAESEEKKRRIVEGVLHGSR